MRAQHNLTEELQKQLVSRLGELSGKPESSSFFVNAAQPVDADVNASDPAITRISSIARKNLAASTLRRRRYDAALWHADGQFETVTPSFTSLRLSEIPETGGDTLWASGYELYDRFSKPVQQFLEGLTATFIGDGYLKAAETNPDKIKIHEGPRGSPLNVGKELKAVHPVVRTHPVSGWKCIFPVGPQHPRDMGAPKYINELNEDESAEVLKKFYDMILQNHDMTVRFKWRNANDMGEPLITALQRSQNFACRSRTDRNDYNLVIWDNRCVFHSATFDYDGYGDRVGARIAGLGERPYFDPNSKSRTEALAEI